MSLISSMIYMRIIINKTNFFISFILIYIFLVSFYLLKSVIFMITDFFIHLCQVIGTNVFIHVMMLFLVPIIIMRGKVLIKSENLNGYKIFMYK